MGNLVVVTILEGLKQDDANITRLFLVIVALLYNTIEQLSPEHLLRNQIVKLWLLKDIVESDNVPVLQFGQDGNLILKSNFILLGKLRFGDNLNSKGFTGLLVRSFLNYREGTLSELISIGK